MTFLVSNPDNETDGGTLELDGASSVVSADVGGFTYVFVAGGVDDGISVFRLLANGTLTPVHDVTDDATLELDGARGLSTAMVDGNTYLFAAGQADNGVSVFRVNTNGSLTNVANVTDDATMLLTGVSDTATARVGSSTYLYTAGTTENGISIFRVNGDGRLTYLSNQADAGALELAGVRALTQVTIGATAFLIAGGTDDGISVFSINASTGALTGTDDENDTGSINLNDVSDITTAVIGGVTYVFVAGAADNGVSVYSLSGAGLLTHLESESDSATSLIAGANSVTVTVLGGITYLHVGGTESGTSLYQFIPTETAGRILQHVDQIADSGSRELSGTTVTGTASVGGTTYLLGAGATDDGVSVFGTQTTGQVWYSTEGNLADARIAFVNTDGGNHVTFLDNNPGTTLTTGFVEAVAIDSAAGLYYAIVTGNEGINARLIMGHIGSLTPPTVVFTFDPTYAGIENNLTFHIDINTFTETLYIGFINFNPFTDAGAGIRQFSYNPTTGAVSGGSFLVTETTAQTPPSTAGADGLFASQDMAFDTTRGVFYSQNLALGDGFETNTILRFSLANPGGAAGVSVINQAQFPLNGNGSDFTTLNGIIADIEIDEDSNRLYFLTRAEDVEENTGEDAIWMIANASTAVNATATKLTLVGVVQADFYPEDMTLDEVNNILYIETENSNLVGGGITDAIMVFQLDAAGTTATLINTINLSFGTTANLEGMHFNYIAALSGISGTATPATEQGASLVLLTGAPTVSDFDGDHLASATVQITGGTFNSNENSFDDDDLGIGAGMSQSGTIAGTNITIAWNQATGTLTLTGYDTFANYQAALATVRYQSTGNNPTNYGLNPTRTITWTVSDGLPGIPGGQVNSATTQLNITAINDGPTNTVPGAQVVAEDSPLNLAISIADPDLNPAITDIVVTLTATNGTLTLLTNVALGLTAGDIVGNGTGSVTITATRNEINNTLGAVGGLVFLNTPDYNGPASVTIVTNDGGNTGNDPGISGTGTTEQDSDTINITVNAVVDIANDTANFAEDSGGGAQTIDVLANDTFENAARFISSVTQGLHGVVTIVDGPDADGIMDYVVYTQVGDYNGSDSFTYTVTSGGVTEVATVNVTITAVADAVDDALPIAEDAGTVTVDVLGNDSFENAARFISGVTQGAHGVVAIVDGPDADGIMDYVTYTAVADYNGTDTFTYTVTSGGVTEVATVNVTISAVADIMDDLLTVNEDSGTTTVDVVGNDSFENAGRFISAVTQGANGGTVAIIDGPDADGIMDYVTYTPGLNYNGPDSFTYTITSGGVTETATVNVTVTAVNDAPLNVVPGAQAINEDASVTFSTGNANAISVSDVDVGAGNLTVTLSIADGALTLSGTVGLVVSGNSSNLVTLTGTAADINTALNGLVYAPPVNANGSRTLTVTTNDNGNTGTDPGGVDPLSEQDVDTVTINIAAVNDTPVVTAAASGSSTEQVAGTVDATATIADADLDAINGGNGNYAGATLTIANNGGNDANDLFAIGTSGAFTVNGSNLEAGGGLVFATFSGGNGTPLVVSFTSSGTPATTALVNAVVQSIQYTYTGDNPPVAGIDVAISLNDGAPANAGQGSIAGHPATGTDIIHLSITNTPENQPPVINNLNGDIATFTEGDVAAVLLDDSSLPELAATVTDADNPASFNGGSLTVSITANENAAQDVLGVSTGGTVTLSSGTNVGSVVSVGGLAVGTVTANGTGGNDLVIAFDTTDATPANISTLIGALTYFNSGGLDPSTAARTVSVTVTDGLGGSGSANVTVNVVGINQEPTLVATGADPTLTEGGLPADLFGSVTASTIESGQTFVSMTVTVTNVTDGASESLTFDGSTVALTNGNSVLTATNGLTVNVTVSGTTATVTFSGAALSAGALQTLVDGLAYGNSSDNPTDGNRVVTITEIVDSGSNVSPNDSTTTLAIASTVNVDPVNDNPANSVPGTQTINEEGSLTLSTANLNAISVSDPDATLLTVTLTVTNGTLTLASTTNLSFGAGDGSGDTTMTFTGTAADINAALGSGLTYAPNLNFNGSDSIAISTTDNGQAGSGGTQTDNDSVTVNVTPINDQPNIPNSPTVTTDEQVAVTLNAAITVSDVDLDARNGGAGDYSGAAFAINRSVSDAEDVFSFNTVGAQFTVNGSNLESGGNVIATLAQAGGILNINFVNNGTVPTTALVNDVLQHLQYTNTSNEPPASVTLIYIIDDGAPGGGQGALGAPFNNIDGGQITVNINSVNDAPSGTNNTVTLNEDTGHTFTAADFGFSDTAESDGFAGVVLTTLPTAGILVYDSDGPGGLPGVLAAQGQFITAAQLALGALTYFPASNANGDDYATFTFQVRDDGGTANNGQNTDQSANTITLDVTAVDDRPTGTDKTITLSEDDPYTFTVADFGFGDVDPDNFVSVTIDTLATDGTLLLNGVAVTMGQTVSVTDINNNLLTFQPTLDEYSSPYATFTFTVNDDGGAGLNSDAAPNTITLNVTPDNLPPAVDLDGGTGGVNYTTIYVEDAPGVAIGSGVTVSDPDSGLGDMIESAVVTLTDRVAGDALTLTGVLPPGIIAVTNLAAGTITMTITGPGTGAQYQALIESILYSTTNQDPTVGGTDAARTITVVVNDGTISSATATTTVNITALDDAPTAQPDAYTITESGTIVGGNLFADNGSGADGDPDGPPLAVSAVGGGPGANVGTQFTLDSGATLTVNANGTFDYNPGSVFLPTPTAGSGASNTPSHDSFTYTLAGGNTVTVSITLTGLDTNDTLLGTAGADYLSGGNGNDTYYVENASDQVNELNGAGDDRVIASTSYALVGGTYVETLEAAAGTSPINLTGNAFDNAVIGNAGANVLYGGGGAGDVLTGLGGNDVYYTDVASTQIVEVGGEGNDTLYTSVSYTLAGFANIETLSTNNYASTDAINLTGNFYAQTVIGNAGNNILHGGGGADILIGLGGNDIYYTDVAATTVQESAGGGNDIVYTSLSYVLAAGQEVEILSTNLYAGTAAINLTGNGLNQTIFGNAGNNILHGGGGTDMLYGLGGNDTYYVDVATTRVFENPGDGNDIVYASLSFTLGADQEIETLSTNSYASTSAINLTGNVFANTLIGNAGANILDGQGGNDTLIGLDGADTYAFTTGLGAGNVDNVLGFVHNVDKIALDDATFAGIGGPGALNANAFHTGSAAHDLDDRIIYDSATGQLFYDADGSGAGAAVQFANLSPGLGLTASDFLVI